VCLSSSEVSATVQLLGETEASSAGEQLAEGYPSRAMTNRRQGRPPGLPALFLASVIGRPCLQKLPPEGRNRKPSGCSEKVVRISGNMWSYFPEPARPTCGMEQVEFGTVKGCGWAGLAELRKDGPFPVQSDGRLCIIRYHLSECMDRPRGGSDGISAKVWLRVRECLLPVLPRRFRGDLPCFVECWP
jgi:hypothetical protein